MFVIYKDNTRYHEMKMKMLPVVIFNSKYKGDKGLYKHGQIHCAQYYTLFALTAIPLFFLFNWFIALIVGVMAHDLAYTLIRPYRQFCEVMAFKKQLKYNGSIDLAAKHLAEDYDLNITEKQAKELLSK